MTRDTLSLPQARRIALAAQGFADPGSDRPPDARRLRRLVERLGVLQIDSVNVLLRAHYMPAFSRLGAYPMDQLDQLAGRKPRRLFEYWGHEASLLPVRLHPYLRWRMHLGHQWGVARWARENPDFVTWVRDEVRDKGPLTAREIEHDAPRRKDHWGWNWSEVKKALECLFWEGQVTAARRNGSFERVYDLPERSLPAEVVNAPTPERAEAHRELIRTAAVALGVATEPDLRDYYRLGSAESRVAVAELVEAGELRPVTVAGWRHPAYLHPRARVPRRIEASTLLSPFDPLIWERSRTERLFGFRYRIEIYVPASKRVYGYYVLPFLLGDRLVARVDLKADRKAGVLRVPAAWAEPDSAAEETAPALASALQRLAGFLGLEMVADPERGDLAAALRAALRSGTGPATSAPSVR
ncbi:MAG: winged helix-turn-helix domain-containing protein [Micromonosporaceae bacterium]